MPNLAAPKERPSPQQVLEAARRRAIETRGYCSAEARRIMADTFSERFDGKCVHSWQLDTAEALVLGLDCVIIAGTGAGKTIPYMLPLFLPECSDKTIVVISPLKSLQHDQARRFRRAGIRAAAVNGDTWCKRTRDLFVRLGLSGAIAAFIIDEAHCISQWGGDFRPAYTELNKIRTYIHGGIPIGAFSATLPPSSLEDAFCTLQIRPEEVFHVNLGNDRPNIKLSVRVIKSLDDFSALNNLIAFDTFLYSHEIPKTIIFANTRDLTQRLWRYIRSRICDHLHHAVDFVHSLRSQYSRIRTLTRFREGAVRILVGTESVGMGADIPDVMHVIHFGVPSSLSIWTQRAGRAGRSPEIRAEAVMLVERAVFQVQRQRQRRKRSCRSSSVSVGSPEAGTPSGPQFKKDIESVLREWIEAPSCRREVSDRYFGNPPRKSEIDPSACCDRCASQAEPFSAISDSESDASSAPSSPSLPSRSTPQPPFDLYKHRMHGSEHTASGRRLGKHRESAIQALKEWRCRQGAERYSQTVYTVEAVLPENVLRSLAYRADLRTMTDLRTHFGKRWALLERHGSEILHLLRGVDEQWTARMNEQSSGKENVSLY
ncbi:P-loop containing nucleoside triphosphate hydrolase protein [Trametes sanguinea]|nr:P-loop containing nucleoside triphosphate hydrolase protein [Trametes sanguinea]